METVEKAIKNITRISKTFPKKEFEIISANREAAIPYLRSAVEKAIQEEDNLDEHYQLHFYALFLLAEFQDRESFPLIMEFASLPREILDSLIGDLITEGLNDILYNTYNGDIQLLKQGIYNVDADDFARSAMLDVLRQLYLDQSWGKQEWQDFLRGIVYEKKTIGDYIYTAIASTICDCHFWEMLPEIRQLYRDERVDLYAIGEYDESVDWMFTYRDYTERLCKSPINAAENLKHWYMFEDSHNQDYDKQKREEFLKRLAELERKERRENVRIKIGRNDPCPCGSGKKYKQCCLNKPRNTVETIESLQEKEKWLKDYPPIKEGGEEGRIYLEDFYGSESIEIDKLLYLALKHRAIPVWRSEPEGVADQRKRVYLTAALKKFMEFVERENIKSFSEYDEKYSIHYFCEEWLGALRELLREKDEEGILNTVCELFDKMGKDNR